MRAASGCRSWPANPTPTESLCLNPFKWAGSPLGTPLKIQAPKALLCWASREAFLQAPVRDDAPRAAGGVPPTLTESQEGPWERPRDPDSLSHRTHMRRALAAGPRPKHGTPDAECFPGL